MLPTHHTPSAGPVVPTGAATPAGPAPYRPGPRGPAQRRRTRRLRRLLAAGLVAGAGGGAVLLVAPPRTPTRSVPVAALDLPAGTTLAPGDVRSASWPLELVPDGTRTEVVGAVLAGPVRRGEPLTDARVLGAGVLTGQPTGTLAVLVPLDPAATAAGVAAGARVDVLVPTEDPVTGAAAGARRIGRDLVVLAVTPSTTAAFGTTAPGSPTALVAADPATAEALTAAGDRARLALRAP
ncbi:SAF domain-containing protein [Kineococcus gynurae]|uniref:SAF domain-containing protein n=1 Tax=Kineococcus gynurae TaxID=452979 RepID=A0ABV5LWS6_9ACTN